VCLGLTLFLKGRMFAPIFLGKKNAHDLSHAKADNVSFVSLDFDHHYASWKIRAKLFFYSKYLIFKSFNPKTSQITSLEYLETNNSSTQNTKRHSKN